MTTTLETQGMKVLSLLLAASLAFPAMAQAPYQAPYYSGAPEQGTGPSVSAQVLAPAQLENLVAPVALYPDQLLSQLLAASTYPLEIVAAQQWLQQNGNLQGTQLMDAARQQNWDPSVQALVGFPDAMTILTRDVQWTAALGNAFLAQQADVMDAIQRLRARAQNNGRLQSTPQQMVTTQAQYGQSAIQIQPADQQNMYVPYYNPEYAFGPAAGGGYYPPLNYPPASSGSWFGPAVNIASLFTGIAGLFGWGGWGWALSWLTHGLFLNGLFFNHYGFHGFGGGNGYGGYGAHTAWAHNPVHRMGVPYANRALATRFGGSFRESSYGNRGGYTAGGRSFGGGSFAGNSFARGSYEGSARNSFTGSSFAGSGYRSSGYSGTGYASNGYRSPGAGASNYNSGYRGGYSNGYAGEPNRSSLYAQNFSSRGGERGFSAPRSAERSSAPRASSQHFSAPRSSGSHFSSGHGGGGGHSSGGGHSHGGGHRK